MSTRPNIQMYAGQVIEATSSPTFNPDMCGLPSHVTPEQSIERQAFLYERARDQYADGKRRAAADTLFLMGQASGHYGLGSGKEAFPTPR